jgi:UDP-glucose 4-epimerase
VAVLDDFSSGSPQNLSGLENQVELFEGDVRDRALLARILKGKDAVFHLAGMASVPLSQEKPDLCLEINGQGTLNVFSASEEAGVRRLVFASSSAVYGDLPSPHGESMNPRPNTPYAAMKMLGENLGLYFASRGKLSAVSLRYFNVYGPRQSSEGPDAGVLPLFVQALREGKAARLYGDGSQTRDFIQVRDAVKATLLAAHMPLSGCAVFNVGSGREASLREVLAILSELWPGLAEPEIFPSRQGDPLHSRALVGKAREGLGFEASISLYDGLKELLGLPFPKGLSGSLVPKNGPVPFSSGDRQPSSLEPSPRLISPSLTPKGSGRKGQSGPPAPSAAAAPRPLEKGSPLAAKSGTTAK